MFLDWGLLQSQFANIEDRGVTKKRCMLTYQGVNLSALVAQVPVDAGDHKCKDHGEEDAGGAFIDGENELRKYLSRIRDQSLVEEYGTWLANRNPKLGVQVFADDHSRVKFEPTHAVELLKEKAPGAVKEYLEYLVFGKKVRAQLPLLFFPDD